MEATTPVTSPRPTNTSNNTTNSNNTSNTTITTVESKKSLLSYSNDLPHLRADRYRWVFGTFVKDEDDNKYFGWSNRQLLVSIVKKSKQIYKTNGVDRKQKRKGIFRQYVLTQEMPTRTVHTPQQQHHHHHQTQLENLPFVFYPVMTESIPPFSIYYIKEEQYTFQKNLSMSDVKHLKKLLRRSTARKNSNGCMETTTKKGT